MAYKKYIKRGGKLYGPYIYHSKRVDGRVISEYRGQDRLSIKKISLAVLGFILLISVIYFFVFSKGEMTGKVTLNLDADYFPSQALQGKLKLSIQEGELIPASSKIIFENNENVYEYLLKDLVSEEITQGNFYVKNSDISGNGDGYGISGKREIFPYVQFVLIVESLIEDNDSSVKLNEISGKVSAEEPFVYVYDLDNNEINAELKRNKIDGTKLKLTRNQQGVVITTDYFEIEEGFGENFLGKKEKDILIDVSSLNLILNKSDLKIVVIDENYNSEIASFTTSFEEGKLEIIKKTPSEALAKENSEKKQEFSQENLEISEDLPEQNIILPEIFDEQDGEVVFLPSEESLSENERRFLISHFGENATINAHQRTERNWIIVRYELGNYWIENAYSSDLSKDTLTSFKKRDRIKWLKDLFNSLSNENKSDDIVNEFSSEIYL